MLSSDGTTLHCKVSATRKIGTPIVEPALAIVRTFICVPWSAYDSRVVGTQLGASLRRPRSERTISNKSKAISFAAYRALVDVLPGDQTSVYDPLMASL